jgi:hypothetical protein
MQPASVAEPDMQSAPLPPASCPATIIEDVASFDAPGPEVSGAAKGRFYCYAVEAAGRGVMNAPGDKAGVPAGA